ncbi:MAG: resolvase [Veillonellales bacterium]
MEQQLIIAVDPGREKCGVAVVHKTNGALWRQVVAAVAMADTVSRLAAQYAISTVVLGDRTTSRQAAGKLAGILVNGGPLTVIPVDEHRSTDAARQRYWRENPPRGLKRLIPVTMQVPPVPVDDYVAVILAERYFGR